jgi:hypothetical protein
MQKYITCMDYIPYMRKVVPFFKENGLNFDFLKKGTLTTKIKKL